MSNNIANEDTFPADDVPYYHMNNFVREFCTKPEALLAAGLKYENENDLFSFLVNDKRTLVVEFIKDYLIRNGNSYRTTITTALESHPTLPVRCWGETWTNPNRGYNLVTGYIGSLKRDGFLQSNGIFCTEENGRQMFSLS